MNKTELAIKDSINCITFLYTFCFMLHTSLITTHFINYQQAASLSNKELIKLDSESFNSVCSRLLLYNSLYLHISGASICYSS